MTLKKQKILITGGAGFIASNITDLYIEEGHEVVIVDNLSTGAKTNIPKKAKFYQEDICNLEKLDAIFKEERPSLVNHHAAQIDVRTSISNPQKDAQINIIGAINLLELARKYEVSKLIYAGTGGALYGELKNDVVEKLCGGDLGVSRRRFLPYRDQKQKSLSDKRARRVDP
ncbi:MAG: NAD-dependent epimerase/dehydratase family protein, partial [Deltaproteobacteria bacterium]|nr:NAD-dependent epimerase/dehydratase family protein [Deltaproteobacteria bacterium]